MTEDADTVVRAAAWKVALDADARGERPLGVEDWLALTRWLEADPRHAALLDAVEDAGLASAGLPRRNRSQRGRAPRRAALGLATAAAAAVATLMIAVVVSPSRRTAVDAVAANTPRAITLPDGSAAVLNRRTRLRARFSARERRLDLTPGSQAVFDIVHDPTRPLTVAIDGTSVTVLGTRFDIDETAGRLKVAVARGTVLVALPKGELVRLPAGRALTRTESGAVSVQAADPQDVDAWTRGSLIYDETPLAQVASDLSRYSREPIAVDEDAAPLRFTGALSIDKASLMLARLATFIPIEAYRTPMGVRLRATRPHR